MKTLAILAFSAGLVVAGAASAHSHSSSFMPSGMGHGNMGDNGYSDNDKTDTTRNTGDGNSKNWTKTGDDNSKLTRHEWRKDERHERFVRFLENRIKRLEMEIAKLEILRADGIGNPERIKLEISRLDRELLKIANELRSGGTQA